MNMLTIIIYLIAIGVLLWLINSFIPMASSIKTILNIVVVVAVIIWLLNIFGIMDSVKHMLKIPVTHLQSKDMTLHPTNGSSENETNRTKN